MYTIPDIHNGMHTKLKVVSHIGHNLRHIFAGNTQQINTKENEEDPGQCALSNIVAHMRSYASSDTCGVPQRKKKTRTTRSASKLYD